MKKVIFRTIFIIALVAFVGAVGYIVYTYIGYKKDAKVYDEAISEFVTVNENAGDSATGGAAGSLADGLTGGSGENKAGKDNINPFDSISDGSGDFGGLEVDFDALTKLNPDIIGWIYCPDTVINYPVLKTDNNDYYLHRNYKKEYAASGSIFVECANSDGFVDSNTIIYGHHMKDGSMFASLSKWFKQEYYDEHPYMYLYTPDGNYRVELFSAYTTAVGSDSYYAILTPCKELDEYLERVKNKSQFDCNIELNSEDKYIMLSTCAYVFENARSVLHGKLVPIK
ncbi:MAG: class B sortase [Lachnospiraceae bacterium]|nr:class B sortase [Lachnospiraceae bacterium]